MVYVIAIPSYNRPHAIKTHTLKVLEEGLIPREIIHIFVSDDNQYTQYKEVLGNDYTIIIGLSGLRDQRNFISSYFPLNTNIVSIDDDIQQFYIKSNDTLEILEDLDLCFRLGFSECEKSGAKMFGFYPCLNKMFMKGTITNSLRFIIGSCFGYINSGIFTTVSEKDDFERTMMYYLRDKKVIRFNYISMKTKYYKMKGGLQSFSNRLEEQINAVEYLTSTYSTYIKRKKSFKSGFPEIRFVLVD
jgi:hypothetical protein